MASGFIDGRIKSDHDALDVLSLCRRVLAFASFGPSKKLCSQKAFHFNSS
ncbi:hypothetical protein QE369_003393 [Agrobacterium larrymoorei]|uniref:Uncharacterized protein n=1 Tax=Agrobacterium larrymoorei TaxID=160699 RepID=A0AAJ2ESK9_9HYPH|nr:hypothetical protein [Agrobacterium larrymoorei]